MLLSSKLKGITALLLSIFLAGCAGSLGGVVKEENRDTTGAFDGLWKVEVQKAAGLQYHGKWNMRCGDMRRTFNMRVVDGAATVSNAKDAKKAYVSSKGAFKLIYPLTEDARASGNSSITMANGDRKLILSGKLTPDGGDSKGYITFGIAEVGYGGCTAKTIYSLASAG